MKRERSQAVRRVLACTEIYFFVMALFASCFIISESTNVQGVINEVENPIREDLEGQFRGTPPPASQGETPGVKPEAGGIGALIKNVYGGTAFGGKLLGSLVGGAAWAASVYVGIRMLAPLFGADEQTGNALALAGAAGAGAGSLSYFLVKNGVIGTTKGQLLGLPASQGAFVIGLGAAIVVFALTYKKEKKQVVELQCLPWEAPLGGADCERCNGDPLKPCSEYRCKALGQACDLVNKGSTEERCVWVARNDVNSPTLTPWTDALTPKHRYTPLQTRPTALGTTIVSGETRDGCIVPFTPLSFGLITNEPSQCKIDTEGQQAFDDMGYYFGESNLFRYNHTQQLRLPSPDSLNIEGLDVPTEGIYNFYVRCRDANGNVNEDEFVFNFCVDKSPDTTPPLIEETSIISGSPVSFAASTVPLSLYLNEPAECRWGVQDKDYTLMENNMSCSSHVYEQNAQQQYPCSTELTGIKDRTENAFFFRCKDQPLKPENERNTNQESYRFMLRGSEPLSILSVGPNATLRDNTDVIAVNLTVRTDDGSDEGVAICSFSESVDLGFIPMFETESFTHAQILTLPAGTYTYHFRCVDAGGNTATANTTFAVLTDRGAPQITRLYRESDVLTLITQEDSICTYSLTTCNFPLEEGIELVTLNSQNLMVHAAPWKPEHSYYIKCKDNYGNQPAPNSCSVIARASNLL